MTPKKEEVWRNFRMSLEIFEGQAFCCIKHSYRSDILKPVILLLRSGLGKLPVMQWPAGLLTFGKSVMC